jgi:hypothetical protein
MTVESVDLRATTPEILAWLQRKGLRMLSMEAEPVTLTETHAFAIEQRSCSRERALIRVSWSRAFMHSPETLPSW